MMLLLWISCRARLPPGRQLCVVSRVQLLDMKGSHRCESAATVLYVTRLGPFAT